MITRLVLLPAVFALQACSSPPKPPEPSGQWVPVNQPATQGAQQSTQSLAHTESK
ncbi:hypothetical protein [Paraburkholderia fungorum]